MLSQPSAFVRAVRSGTILAVFSVLDRHDWLLGDAVPQHPDFTRYSRTQRDQNDRKRLVCHNDGADSFIGVAVTSATIVIYARRFGPVVLIRSFKNPRRARRFPVRTVSRDAGTNLAANVVSPANDFSNLWPSRITFRIGGLITGIIGI